MNFGVVIRGLLTGSPDLLCCGLKSVANLYISVMWPRIRVPRKNRNGLRGVLRLFIPKPWQQLLLNLPLPDVTSISPKMRMLLFLILRIIPVGLIKPCKQPEKIIRKLLIWQKRYRISVRDNKKTLDFKKIL